MRFNWESISAPQSIEGLLRLSAVAVVAEAVKTPAAAIRGLWRLPAIRGIAEQWTVTGSIKKTRKTNGSMVSSDSPECPERLAPGCLTFCGCHRLYCNAVVSFSG